MTTYADLIRAIDPAADVERVLELAGETFRYFGEMRMDDWRWCVSLSRERAA